MSLPKICTCPTAPSVDCAFHHQDARGSLAAMPGSGVCPHCAIKIPGWWVRDYCANCGEEIPQSEQQAEIARLRKAIEDIDDITGFDWPTMPETIKQDIHRQLREIVLTALARPNADALAPPPQRLASKKDVPGG